MRALVLLALISAPLAHGALYNVEDCRVVKVVDDNHFEEGLSTHEYPSIGITKERGKLSVSVGAMMDWQETKGDVVVANKHSAKKATYRFKYRDGRHIYTFAVDTTSTGRRQGKLSVKEGNKLHLIAVAYCKGK